MFGHKLHKYAGEVEYIGLDGKSVVKAIKKCCHCGGHWVSQPGSGNRRGFCRNCMGDVCSDACSHNCTPFEKQMDEFEKMARSQQV